MKRRNLMFTISLVIVFMSAFIVNVKAQENDTTWQVIEETYLPNTYGFVETPDKQIYINVDTNKVYIDYDSYLKYFNGQSLLVLTKSKKDSCIKYTIREQSKDDLMVDIKYLLHNYKLLLNIIYETNPSLLDVLLGTEPYANIYMIDQEYKPIVIE